VPVKTEPILVAGFDRYAFLCRNPASTLVDRLEERFEGDPRFRFNSRIPVVADAPLSIRRLAWEESAKSIVVFGLDWLPMRHALRLEQFAGRRAGPWKRLKGIPSGEPGPRFRVVDGRIVAIACGVPDVARGSVSSAGRDICNWTFYRLAGGTCPTAFVHLPIVHLRLPTASRRKARLRAAETLLERLAV
jgi:pyrrolidone-carboxylate peptidase